MVQPVEDRLSLRLRPVHPHLFLLHFLERLEPLFIQLVRGQLLRIELCLPPVQLGRHALCLYAQLRFLAAH